MKPGKKAESRAGRAVRISVAGVVQGVGFRPFIHRLARRFNFRGWVKNFGSGVEIHLESGHPGDFSAFLTALREEKPPLCRIEQIESCPAAFRSLQNFRIRKSRGGESFVFISPDIATCPSCREEVMNPRERRHSYPFTNCTDCGPRYTIVKSLPYDRKQTTMAGFAMCGDCSREYNDLLDRRYHAQPIACPACGPQVMLRSSRTGKLVAGGIPKAASLIKEGKILAVKGLGGFHLICKATDIKTVRRLRRIKARKTKPLALMALDMDVVERFALVDEAERQELLSPTRPIVLLKKKKDIPGIAPHLDEMGAMLPYTPLHHLLLQDLKLVVATSSNQKDAPIIKDEKDGIRSLCDFILSHDRPIHMRTDDSVMKVAGGKPLFQRRARGYVPYPQKVPRGLESDVHILALGGELKDTVSVYKNGYVITSQFLGDLDDYRNFCYFEETINHLIRLFDVKPEAVVSDLHPNFHTTRFAEKSGLPHFRVQHHFSHILAPLVEHGIPPDKKVLGVSFDGYGYGDDGAAWGGEFLIADYSSYRRMAHFRNVPLPGGDLAARQPWRMAISYLKAAFGDRLPKVRPLERLNKGRVERVLEMIDSKVNCPPTSSCGRLFDAVAYLAGLSPEEVEFEAEAPMRLEAAAREDEEASYDFTVEEKGFPFQLSFEKTVRGVVEDLSRGVPAGVISARFHNTLARAIAYLAKKAAEKFGINTVVLAGGVFLNKKLLLTSSSLLEKLGFVVLRPIQYSPNDESLSLGQIGYALARLKGAGERPRRVKA